MYRLDGELMAIGVVSLSKDPLLLIQILTKL